MTALEALRKGPERASTERPRRWGLTSVPIPSRRMGSVPFVLVLGVFLGSAAWWLLLAGGVSMLHRRLPAHLLERVRQGSALLLLGFGAWALWSALA